MPPRSLSSSLRRMRIAALVGTFVLAGGAGALFLSSDREPSSRLNPPTQMQQAYESLRTESERAPNVQIHNGMARFVDADVRVTGATAADQADDFVRRYGALYGLSPSSSVQLVLRGTRSLSDQEELVSYDQWYQGVEVFGGQLLVSVHQGHVYSTIGTLFQPTQPLNVTPELTSAQAIERSRILTNSKRASTYADPLLEIYDPAVSDSGSATTSQPHLAWRVFLATPERKELHIDAHSGALLTSYSATMDSFDFDLQDANGNEATNANGCYWLTSDDDAIGDEDGLEQAYHSDRDAVAAWWGGRRTYDFFRNRFGMDSYDDDGEDVEAYIHAGGSVIGAAASYNPGCDIFQFSNGNVGEDIFVHEYTHAVIAVSSNLVYQNQPGALNEAFADIMGATYDGNWLVGESRTGGSDPFRDMSNPTRMGHPDTMPPRMITTDNGGVHTNSGIMNKVAFLISEGGVHNQQRVDGIGRQKMGSLIFNVMRSLPSSAQFNDARNRTVALADQWGRTRGNGFTPRDACAVRNAFFAAGFRAWDDNARADVDCDGVEDNRDPDRDNDAIPDTRDNCPSTPNIDQRDSDRNGLGDACDNDADRDGIPNNVDNCPNISNPRQEPGIVQGDNRGFACQDADEDGILNPTDNCPLVRNMDQTDQDRDGLGNACDPDGDGDGIVWQHEAYYDNCPDIANADQRDTDRDHIGDVCDNCLNTPNFNQRDIDRDGQGDVCDADRDGDGITNNLDRCPERQLCLADGTQIEQFEVQIPPGTPSVEPRRFPLPPELCPNCGTVARATPSSSCQGLVIQGALPTDRFWISNEIGSLAGRFYASGTRQLGHWDVEGGEEYFLNIQPTVRRTTSPTTITISLNPSVCEQNIRQAPRRDGAYTLPADFRVTSSAASTSRTGAEQPAETKENLFGTPTPSTDAIQQKETLNHKQAEETKQEPTVNERTKEDPLQEQPTSPILKEEPIEPRQEQPPIVQTPSFSSIRPSIEKLSQDPSLNLFYGTCPKDVTRLQVQFNAESANRLRTIAVTYQVLGEDGSNLTPWRNVQLLSFGGNRFGINLDTATFAKNDLQGANGFIRYQILLVDEAGLRATLERTLNLNSCNTQKN